MKNFTSKQKKYFITMIILIFICEILLKINNNIIKSFGVCILPFIIICGLLLLRSDQKSNME